MMRAMRDEGRFILSGPDGPVDLGSTALVSQLGRIAAGIAVADGSTPDFWAQMAVGETSCTGPLPSLADIGSVRTGLAETATPGVRVAVFDVDGAEQAQYTWFSLIGRTILPDSDALDDLDDLDDVELVLTRGVVRLETSETSAIITGFRQTGASSGEISGPGGQGIVDGAAAALLSTWGPVWHIEQITCLEVFSPVLDKLLSIVADLS